MTGEDVRTAAAALAVAISTISLVITRMQARRAERFGRRPVLVLRTNKERTRWLIENIGAGPAFDVVCFQSADASWKSLRMPELAAGGDAALPAKWLLSNRPHLLVRYRSVALRERYVTETHDDLTEVSVGWGSVPPADETPSHNDFL